MIDCVIVVRQNESQCAGGGDIVHARMVYNYLEGASRKERDYCRKARLEGAMCELTELHGKREMDQLQTQNGY